ncbi:mitochondrial ribosome-associated GTPase 1 like protein [Babesia gibsoni]|uniref:Mitochondrial ribosome-associated GTPase 1 like protein n=1 Tax=Babesia gibsoni TaxID=33632 RepID=A0AAD8PER2_BABGI|nr:mitochondrial ribosome-associated GTPase 1 like protein [Babesia gibsoni]
MEEPKKYKQRTSRPSGPSLDDFIYRKPPTPDHTERSTLYHTHAPINNAGALHKGRDSCFVPRDRFIFDRSITWYPGHMAKGKLDIGKKKKAVDCILEVRDARAPLTCSNCSLLEEYPEHIPRLVVLNKADLAPKSDLNRVRELLESSGRKVVLFSALGLKKITKITEFVANNVSPKFKTLGVWMMVVGLPNVGKSSIINALKRYSFTQRFYSPAGHGEPTKLKPSMAKCAATAGSTKLIDAFYVSEKPKLFCFDTPGIMLPKMGCPEINLKLAAIGCLDDHQAGEDYIADYILYTLNRKNMLGYVSALGLPHPTDDMRKVMDHISNILERKYSTIEPSNCYRIFINQFRLGHFGRICLDDLHDIVRRGDLSDFELSEPPGPRGPSQWRIHGL